MANSKKKGNKGERELSKWWQLWTGFEFSRVPSSGGLRWNMTSNTVGDIICTNERHSRRFLFSIECKNYKDINFEHLILGNKKIKILEFWKQTNEDAERGNKIPILFMRYNGMPKNTYFVIISLLLFYKLQSSRTAFKYDYFVVPKQDFVIINSNDITDINYITLHKNLKKEIRDGVKF